MPKRKPTKHQDDVLRNIRQPDRYDPKARSIGGPWRMVKSKDGAYVCYEQHMEIIDNLRKNAEINPAQSPHDGIHTCSKGCSKPGCNRGLRDTIEEQDAQIVALKQDLLEKSAELRKKARNTVHDLNLIASLKEDNQSLVGQVSQFEEHRDIAAQIIKRLEAEMEALMTTPCSRLLRAEREEFARLKAENERLRKAAINPACVIKLIEEGVQNKPFKYDEKYIIEVSREAYIPFCEMMTAYWRTAKEGKQS